MNHPAALPQPLRARRPPLPKAVPVVVSAGVAVGVFIGLLVGVGTKHQEPTPHSRAAAPLPQAPATAAMVAATAVPVAPPAPATPAPAQPPEIEIAYTVEPTTATVSVDGKPVSGGQFSVPSTLKAVDVVASAEGYTQFAKRVDVTDAPMLTITLEKLPAAKPASAGGADLPAPVAAKPPVARPAVPAPDKPPAAKKPPAVRKARPSGGTLDDI